MVFAVTSAEDEVGLRGVPEGARERLAEARELLRQGDDDLVAQYLQQASSRSDDYAAAHVLHARSLLASDPLEALGACDKALEAVAGCYEAHACRAEALRRLGRRDEARVAIVDAIALRADWAPAWITRAWLDLGAGETEAAEHALALAAALAPEDPGVTADARALRAWLAGPPGLAPHDHDAEGQTLRVWAPSAADAARAAKQVTAIRQRCDELLGRLFPAPPDAPQTPARVVVFADPAAYTRYLRVAQRRRAGGAVFTPARVSWSCCARPRTWRRPSTSSAAGPSISGCRHGP
jgi:tetratricopeptide (TPR) repeat protein